MSYVATTTVSVVDTKGKRHLVQKGEKVPAAVPVAQCRDLVSVGLVAYVGSANLGEVPAANNTGVPKKSAKIDELRSYVIDADLAPAEQAATLQKAELWALIEPEPPTPPTGSEPPTPPTGSEKPTVGDEGGQGSEGDAGTGDTEE